VGVSDIPNLVVASLDLQLVRLLRGAMAVGDGRCCEPVSGLGPAPNCIERRFRYQPETEILPRKRIEPTPLIEPRQVIRPTDRFEPREADLVPVPVECYRPTRKSVIEPPWKVLPWERPLECRVQPEVKVVVRPPDIVHKGSLIDFFI
jgi:hypothetical protein